MNGSAIISYEQQTAPVWEDFYGFLTADNITLKMLKRAKKCAENNSKIVWIEGESGVGKNLLTMGVIQQYAALKHLSNTNNIAKIIEPQFDAIGQYFGKEALIIPLAQDFDKDCLIKLQQQLINIIKQPQNTPSLIVPSLIIIITYPNAAYSASTAKQISNMRQIFINEQYEYMLLQPLRNRLKDIELLSNHYFAQFERMLNVPPHLHLKEIIANNMDILLKHSWENNVKTLQQYCLLTTQMLNFMPLERNQIMHGLNTQGLNTQGLNISGEKNHEIAPLKRPQLCLVNNISDVNISLLKSDSSMKQFIDLEHEIVSKACRHYRGSKTIAAKELGVGRTTLYRKLNREND